MQILHAPSDCMEFYKDTPQRKLAQSAPQAKNQPKDIAAGCRQLPDEPSLAVDASDGGCDHRSNIKWRPHGTRA